MNFSGLDCDAGQCMSAGGGDSSTGGGSTTGGGSATGGGSTGGGNSGTGGGSATGGGNSSTGGGNSGSGGGGVISNGPVCLVQGISAALTGSVSGTAEDCGTVGVLAFDASGKVVISGTTSTANHSQPANANQPRCSIAARNRGKDRVYSYTLTQTKDVKIQVTPQSGTFDPVLWVRKPNMCASDLPAAMVSQDTLACLDDLGAGSTETVVLSAQAAGTYYVWVDSAADTDGPFTLMVEQLGTAAAPANDTCATAQAITTFPAKIEATTAGAASDYSGNCGPENDRGAGGDVVYTFTTTAEKKLTAKVTPKCSDSRLWPFLTLHPMGGCGNSTGANQLSCATAPGAGGEAEIAISHLPAGTYTLVVDSSQRGTTGTAKEGAFTLDIDLTEPPAAPANTSCGNATALTFDAKLSATVRGTTAGASSSSNVTCPAAGMVPAVAAPGKDVVYSFTTPALSNGQTGWAGRVQLRSFNVDDMAPHVSVVSDCSMATSQVGCFGADLFFFFDPHGFVTLQPSKQYFVWVDGLSAQDPGGEYQLDVDLAPVPAGNDTCAQAYTLPANVSLAGSTIGAVDNMNKSNGYYSNCPDTLSGPDVAYRFTATKTGKHVAYVAPQRGYAAALAVLKSCTPNSNSCLGTADSIDDSDTEAIVFDATAGESYIVVVDSFTNNEQPAVGKGGFVVGVQAPP